MKTLHMKNAFLYFLAIALICLQCKSSAGKFIPEESTSDCPVRDLITEVPALNEKDIVPVVLEDAGLKAVFDKKTGRLVSLLSKRTNWQIQGRGYLSRSFRMAVPMPGRKDNGVFGERQVLRNVELHNDNKKIVFTWNRLVSDCGQEVDIEFKGIVELTSEGLQFSGSIKNQSPYTVEAVYWPYLGDVKTPEGQKMLNWKHFEYGGGLIESSIYPYFGNHKGYYGVDYPIQTYSTQYSHFGLLGNDNEGLYVGYKDTTDQQLVNFTFELKPGYEYAESMDLGTVPTEDSISGKPIHIEYSCVHFTYANRNETVELKPMILQPYAGDWHQGANYYKTWRKSWTRTLPGPLWAKEVHSWIQYHINSSEDYPRCTYKDLVQFGQECSRHGVKAIQLTGWNLGGQDRGNPSHDIDPRLGTWEDLRTAIEENKKIGVYIVLFSKYTWADESQPWFKNELVKYAAKDPYGNYYRHPGYQYQTAVQLADINTRRLIPMCHVCPAWREVANTEFKKAIELGAAGMLYDECQHHGPCSYCFDPNHGHHVPADVFSGDILLENGFRKITRQMDPEYLFAGEACRDLQLRSYNISYFRIGRNYTPMHRYVAPEANMMVAVIGHDDRNTINQALLYRYIISYEPRNFKGHLDEFPLTVEYGNRVDDLRKRYSDLLWNAEFMDTEEAEVTVEKDGHVSYAVFADHKSGKRAVVISNPSYTRSVTARVELEKGTGHFLMASPEFPDAKENSGRIEIKALSAVVLMEK
jgi:hypothetical protein